MKAYREKHYLQEYRQGRLLPPLLLHRQEQLLPPLLLHRMPLATMLASVPSAWRIVMTQ